MVARTWFGRRDPVQRGSSPPADGIRSKERTDMRGWRVPRFEPTNLRAWSPDGPPATQFEIGEERHEEQVWRNSTVIPGRS